MGVPAFFRWLSRKYPSVVTPCVEEKGVDGEGNPIYDDMSKPNPNNVEFDNLYLDMNGIIHPCTHPEDKPAPKDEDEMMVAIFECIDRLMNIVRPRKLLYMAIDGVAPRAKMNQQRSRRFRASKETAEKVIEINRIREELTAKGCILPPEKAKEAHFDSNCITPGTPFMDRLSKCLQYYVHDRMNNNPGWGGIKVILSDANVPGEGEHKIMDYIRKQRSQPDHDPNTHHVLCGADADLIMLGLATHETHFTIIREEFLPNKDRPCDICQQMGHEMKDCIGLQSERDINKTPPPPGKETEFIFVRLNVLKEYLQKELEMPNLPFKYDFERVIDDWVFMCFFVGNDFLPHLPSLEIRENAIDRLVTLYKKCVYKTNGYLTHSGSVTLNRVEMIMTDLGFAEDEIFRSRKVTEDRFKERNKRMKMEKERQQRPNFDRINKSQFGPTPLGRGIQPQGVVNARKEAAHFRMLGGNQPNRQQQNQSDSNQEQRGQKRKADEPLSQAAANEEEETPDEVRLYEEGFKDRYYESKFDVKPNNVDFRQTVAWEYVRGLCWVLKYYYQGCASWEWYFPYHYAPFASDFKNLTNVNTHFDRGTPFKPLQQLMGVFPAASRSHVPAPFAELMVDPTSPIIDFYPIDFHIDLNGKKFAWQGVALLPFVDEKRLFKATDPRVPLLTHEERLRNENGLARLYLPPGNEAYKLVVNLYKSDVDYTREVPILAECMRGLVIPAKENVPRDGVLPSPIPGLYPVCENKIVMAMFLDPKYDDDFVFPSIRLEGARDQPQVLKASDRPHVGFAHKKDCFARLGGAGHRMLSNYVKPAPNAGGGRQGDSDRSGKYNNFRRGATMNDNNSNNSNTRNVSSTNTGNNNQGGMSVFEQLSSRLNHYQQQVMSEISRHASTSGAILPNPFANQFQYDYNTAPHSMQQGGRYQQRGGRNNGGHNQGRYQGGNQGNNNYQYQQRNNFGGAPSADGNGRYNNNNRFGQNNAGGNRFNNNRRHY